jgi:hypothetical protein
MNNDNVALRFSVDDFHQRWMKARIFSLRQASNSAAQPDLLDLQVNSSLEADIVDEYFSQNGDVSSAGRIKSKDTLLRKIFDNSRLLGRSLSKHLGISFEVQDFQNLLERSTIPCVQGQWESRKSARILKRSGCSFCTKAGADACDYWREALDGLVMGLGEKERLARHASIRHGDNACVDVFYFETEWPKESGLAWGPLPEHMVKSLTEICNDFESKMKTSILLKGLSEGVLYFEFKSSTDNHCGGTHLLTSVFQRKLQNIYPGLLVQEVTPRAVLGGKK